MLLDIDVACVCGVRDDVSDIKLTSYGSRLGSDFARTDPHERFFYYAI